MVHLAAASGRQSMHPGIAANRGEPKPRESVSAVTLYLPITPLAASMHRSIRVRVHNV